MNLSLVRRARDGEGCVAITAHRALPHAARRPDRAIPSPAAMRSPFAPVRRHDGTRAADRARPRSEGRAPLATAARSAAGRPRLAEGTSVSTIDRGPLAERRQEARRVLVGRKRHDRDARSCKIGVAGEIAQHRGEVERDMGAVEHHGKARFSGVRRRPAPCGRRGAPRRGCRSRSARRRPARLRPRGRRSSRADRERGRRLRHWSLRSSPPRQGKRG